MKKLTIILALTLIFGLKSYAQTGETELYNQLEQTEKKLDTVFKKLRSKLSEIDQKALDSSQTDWINFRNSNCNFRSLKESEGGVIANKMFIDCKIETTKLRIKELTDLLINGF